MTDRKILVATHPHKNPPYQGGGAQVKGCWCADLLQPAGPSGRGRQGENSEGREQDAQSQAVQCRLKKEGLRPAVGLVQGAPLPQQWKPAARAWNATVRSPCRVHRACGAAVLRVAYSSASATLFRNAVVLLPPGSKHTDPVHCHPRRAAAPTSRKTWWRVPRLGLFPAPVPDPRRQTWSGPCPCFSHTTAAPRRPSCRTRGVEEDEISID